MDQQLQPDQPNKSKLESEEIKHQMVETFAGDVAGAIDSTHGGLVKELIKDEEAREAAKKKVSPEIIWNKIFIICSVVLILLSALLVYIFRPGSNTINTLEVKNIFTPMIFTDKSQNMDVADMTKDQVATAISGEITATTVKVGGIEGIYLTHNTKPVGLREFINLIGSSFFPDSTTLVDNNFLIGVMNSAVDPAPATRKDGFILLHMRSMADIFNNLRNWEKKMFTDLHGALGISLAADSSYKDFIDGIIENKNARILYDNNGQVIMMYVFADDSHVVITDNPTVVHEVIVRLAGNRLAQ